MEATIEYFAKGSRTAQKIKVTPPLNWDLIRYYFPDAVSILNADNEKNKPLYHGTPIPKNWVNVKCRK